MDCSVRYTGNSFNLNDESFTKAVQGSHYMPQPTLDAANKAYRKQEEESKNQDKLKMLLCDKKQNDRENNWKSKPIDTKFKSHYPTLSGHPKDRSNDDIKGKVKLNVEEELSNSAGRYAKEKNHDTKSNSNADGNYSLEGKSSSEAVHKFATRFKTDNLTKKCTAKHLTSTNQKEDKTDQKIQKLTYTKRSLKRHHVLSETFSNGKLVKKNDFTRDKPKTEVKTFKRHQLKNKNIHNKNSDSNISKVFDITKTNNIKSSDETTKRLDKSFHINKSVKNLSSINDLDEYENDDNTVKDTTLSTTWEAFPRDENPFTGGFFNELHKKKGISVSNITFCIPQVICKSKGVATTNITDKEKFKHQTKFNQIRINCRETRKNNQDGFMSSKTCKTVNNLPPHQTIYNAEKSNAKIHRYDCQINDTISSFRNVNDNLCSDNCIDAQFIKEKVAATIDNDETVNGGIRENPHVADDKGSFENMSNNITGDQMDIKNNDKDTTESNAIIPNQIEIDTCSAAKLTQVTKVLFQTTTSKVHHVDIEENSATNVTCNGNFIIPKLIVENYDENSDSTCNETGYKNKNIATKADTNSDTRKIFTSNPTDKNCSTSMFKRYKLSEKYDVTKTITDGYVASNNKRDTKVDHLHATVELNFKELSLDDRKREKARHCTNTISKNVAKIHKLIGLFKMRIANAFGRNSLSTFVAFKERQFREKQGDSLQSIDNTNTDEQDWDVLCYSLPHETGKLKEQIESHVTSLEKKDIKEIEEMVS